MVIVVFPDNTDWSDSNWVYRRFAQDIISSLPDDVELHEVLKEGGAIGTLFLDAVKPPLQGRVLMAMKGAAENLVELHTLQSGALSSEERLRYVESVARLSA